MTDHLTENARLRAALEAAKRDTALALAQVDRLLTLTTTLATERDDSREYAVALEAELKARNALATPAPDAVQEAAIAEVVQHESTRRWFNGEATHEEIMECVKAMDAAVAKWRAIAGETE